jgi:hypothetical protein
MATFPSAVAGDSVLYVAVNSKVTNLTSAIDASQLTIPVTSTTGFPSSGHITIDNEIIHYTSVGAAQFNADARGADGTTAASHLNSTQVSHNVIAIHHNTLKDEIAAIEQNISDRLGLSATQNIAPIGSVSAPSYTFLGDLNTGIYHPSADQLAISSGGNINILVEDTTGVYINNVLIPYVDAGYTLGTATKRWNRTLLAAGTAGAPSYTFGSDLDTGLYQVSVNTVDVSVGGVASFRVRSDNWIQTIVANTGIYVGDGLVSAPVYSFNNNQTCGLYSIATNSIGFSINSVLKWKTTTSGLVVVNVLSVGEDGSGGNLDIYPATASRGKTRFTVANATGNTTTEINVDVQAAARIYKIPDAGADANFVMSEGAATVNGVKTFAGQLIGKGTATNDAASTGYIGEIVSSTVTANTNAPTSGQWGDLTSISLTAGDWDVSVVADCNNAAGVSVTEFDIGVSTTSGNSTPTTLNTDWTSTTHPILNGERFPLSFPNRRTSLSATTTVYLKVSMLYASGTPFMRGRISARRIR